MDIYNYQKLTEARLKAKGLKLLGRSVTELYLEHETPFSGSDAKLFGHITHLGLIFVRELEFEGIDQFINLEFLSIKACSIRKWIVGPFLLPKLKQVELKENTPSKYVPFQKLLRKVVQEQYLLELRKILFYLLANDQQQLKGYNTAQLLEAMVCDMPEIQAAVEKELERRKENPLKDNPLSTKSSIFITGKTHMPVVQMAERLNAKGIRVRSKLEKDTTHVVVGIKPKENLGGLTKSITILAEKHLTDFLNQVDTPYLMEESCSKTDMVKNVIGLLMSDDEKNELTGLELLKQGGVTNEMIPYLMVIKYADRPTKVRDAVKALINQYGSTVVKTAIIKNIRFYVNETTVYTNTNKLLKSTGIDFLEFSSILFRKIKKGRKYLLDKGTTEMRREVIEKTLNKAGTILDLSNIEFTKFPEELFNYDKIQEISLFRHKLKKIPAGFGRMKNLVNLNLFGAPMEPLPDDFCTLSSLKKLFISVEGDSFIPKAFVKLQLEELYIFYMNGMTVIPQEIFQISTLKKLVIAPASDESGEHLISHIPEEITQLKNPELLYVDCGNLKELPKSMGSLPKLRVYLEGSWNRISREALQVILPPQCKIEPGRYNYELFQKGL